MQVFKTVSIVVPHGKDATRDPPPVLGAILSSALDTFGGYSTYRGLGAWQGLGQACFEDHSVVVVSAHSDRYSALIAWHKRQILALLKAGENSVYVTVDGETRLYDTRDFPLSQEALHA